MNPETWASTEFGHNFRNSLYKDSNSTTVFVSDDRLKHNEVNIINALDTINKLKAQTYDMTSDLKTEDFKGELQEGTYRTLSGFIAQEVYQIPELKHAVQVGDIDATENKNIWKLDYNSLFTFSLAAIQELSKKVEWLTNENNSLKSTIESLTKRIDSL